MNTTAGLLKRPVRQAISFGWMVGVSHSIFVLPFALAAVVLARATSSQSVTWGRVFWIVVAVMSCRSAAIGFNRLADMRWDRLNPRTRDWELPRGVISPTAVVIFVMLSAVVFVVAMGVLNLTCLFLSPAILSVAFFHAFTKRFTWTSHFFLGLVYGLAPIGAWIAITGALHPSILMLSAVIASWGAGFDIIYACRDLAFDREWGLYSIPQTFGIPKAIWVSRALHSLSLLGMLALRWIYGLNAFYVFGVVLVGLFLVWGHSAVRPSVPMRRRIVLFDVSGLISIFYFVAVAGGVTPPSLGS